MGTNNIEIILRERLEKSDQDLLAATREAVQLRQANKELCDEIHQTKAKLSHLQQASDLQYKIEKEKAYIEIQQSQSAVFSTAEATVAELQSLVKRQEVSLQLSTSSCKQFLNQINALKHQNKSLLQRQNRDSQGWAADIAALRQRIETIERGLRCLRLQARLPKGCLLLEDKLDPAFKRNGRLIGRKGAKISSTSVSEDQISELICTVKLALDQLELRLL